MRGRLGVFLLGAAGLCPAAHAGSYMRSEGDLSYSTSLGYFWASERWDQQSNLQPESCRREYAHNSHYLEYGYSYYYTLFGGTQLAQARCAAESTTGAGDVRLGVRGRTDLYRNHHTWELVATLPTNRSTRQSPRLGCSAVGVSGSLARKDDVLPWLALGTGVGVELWESPLAHQVDADVSLSGPLQVGRLRWGFELSGRTPLEGGVRDVNSDISDCGTRGKQVKAGLRLGSSVGKTDFVDCSYTRAVWGEDTTLSQGFSCGYSHSWD